MLSNEKKQYLSSTTMQMLAVIIAFAIMGTSSFFFTRNIERKHLINDAENALAYTEAQIAAYILESEALLNGFSQTIRGFLFFGNGRDLVTSYITSVTNNSLNNSELRSGFNNAQGYFNLWGGIYICGRSWEDPDDFMPEETPWYKAAAAAGGKIAATEPYKDPITGNNIISFTQYLYDNNGNPLGVVCIDMNLQRLFQQIVEINLTESSYGVLLNDRMEVLAHREYYLINERLHTISSGLSDLAFDLERENSVYERRVKNYLQEDSIVFFTKINYGWRLGVVIPVSEYYKNVRGMALFLAVLGAIMAALLCYMLYRIAQAKLKSDIRTQQKSHFLATMSHEIRTPLNAILGITDIQMQSIMHPPSTNEAFMKINNSGNLLLNIINDILDLSKIEAGKLELTPVKYEVASVINDIVQLNSIRYESKPIQFNVEIDENTPSILVGDELRIKQILNNVLSNAFKYTDSGSVTFSTHAECIGRGGKILVTLIFRVTDTGQGMTSQQVGKLFDEYTRFNMEANRTTEGAGLGMTITRNLVELMQGQINVTSAVGEGTSVTIRLPQRTDGSGIHGFIGKELAENLRHFKLGNAVQIKKAQVTHEHMPYGKVLIVDDVETNLYVAKGLMAPYGLQIDLATSGYEAIDKIKAGKIYDIIFMDHMMPKMDGIEAAKKIREHGYSYPIVALTANALAGQAEVFLNNGFDGFISKPIDIRQLNVSLNKLIRDKQPQEVIEAAHREKADLEKTKEAATKSSQPDPQLAGIFARDAEKAVALLENITLNNFHTESDLQLYVINVHAMKSALANIGKTELSSVALRLEQAGREKDFNVITEETHKFLDALKIVISEVKPKEDEGENIEDSKESLAFLREKLNVIKDACEAYDKKLVKNTIQELKEKTWSHKTKDLINAIAEHLLHSEFDEIASLTESYIKPVE